MRGRRNSARTGERFRNLSKSLGNQRRTSRAQSVLLILNGNLYAGVTQCVEYIRQGSEAIWALTLCLQTSQPVHFGRLVLSSGFQRVSRPLPCLPPRSLAVPRPLDSHNTSESPQEASHSPQEAAYDPLARSRRASSPLECQRTCGLTTSPTQCQRHKSVGEDLQRGPGGAVGWEEWVDEAPGRGATLCTYYHPLSVY